MLLNLTHETCTPGVNALRSYGCSIHQSQKSTQSGDHVGQKLRLRFFGEDLSGDIRELVLASTKAMIRHGFDGVCITHRAR